MAADIGDTLYSLLGSLELALLLAMDERTRAPVKRARDCALHMCRSLASAPWRADATAQTPIRLPPFHPGTLLEAIITLHRPVATEYGLRIDVRIDRELPHLNLDARWFDRLVALIIGYAIRHSGGSRLELRLRQLSRTTTNSLELCLIDNGRGMDPDVCGHLSDVLQGEIEATRSHDRVGFVAIAEAARLIGAQVHVASWSQVGTKVTIRVGCAESVRFLATAVLLPREARLISGLGHRTLELPVTDQAEAGTSASHGQSMRGRPQLDFTQQQE